MTTPLWPHQQAAADQLQPLGCGMLALDMGTGKTRTALELLQRWQCRRVLILSPKSVCRVWPQEFAKHLGAGWDALPLDTGTGPAREKLLRRAWWCADMDGSPLAVALNYEAAATFPLGDKPNAPGALRGLPWDALILDECHRLKSPTGKQSQFVARLAKDIPHVLALTGTPMPHSPLDIWAQFRALAPDLLGPNFYHFQGTYAQMEAAWVPNGQAGSMAKVAKAAAAPAVPVSAREWIAARAEWKVKAAVAVALREGRPVLADFIREHSGAYRQIRQIAKHDDGQPIYRNLDQLQDILRAYTYRVRADDVLTLPDTQDVHRYCLLGPVAQRVYRDLEDGLAAQIGAGTVSAGNALVKLLRLAQVANGGTVDDETAAYTQLGTEKADLLRETLEDLDPEEPVVVFGRFHTDLDSIHEVAASLGRTSAELSGRRNDLAGWQDGASNVLAVQLKAGGLGVDFTRARVQVYYALDYSLGDYLQTRKRIHRPGQTRAVLYVHLLAAGTVDEAVYAALAKRQEVVDAVVDGLRGRREKSA